MFKHVVTSHTSTLLQLFLFVLEKHQSSLVYSQFRHHGARLATLLNYYKCLQCEFMDIQGLIRSTLITRFWFIFLFFLSIELILEYLLYLGILFLGCIFLVREQIF